MKVIHVNTFGGIGGAGIAAERLHTGLLRRGVDSWMYFQSGASGARAISPQSQVKKLLSSITPSLEYRLLSRVKTDNVPFTVGKYRLVDYVGAINQLNPDIVHLHWIGPGFIKIEDLRKIKAPIVWSMHDMWAFTGGCHYDNGCGQYRVECSNCPILNGRGKPVALKHFRRKHRVYGALTNITFVGLSQWMAASARDSTLLRGQRVVNLPNPIDSEQYSPAPRSEAQRMLGMDESHRYILFAVHHLRDQRKGFSELLKALPNVDTENVSLCVMGEMGESEPLLDELPFNVYKMGTISDFIAKKVIFSACDMLVLPSLQENLSNIVLEGMSFGLPVVAFDIGGNADMIQHQQTGYLAKAGSSEDLAAGIDWTMKHLSTDRSDLVRLSVREKFETNVVVPAYVSLYEQILKAN